MYGRVACAAIQCQLYHRYDYAESRKDPAQIPYFKQLYLYRLLCPASDSAPAQKASTRELMSDLFRNIILNNTPLLDVRAPVEFRKGTLPNAVNIPLLDDRQRHKVGVAYKEQGQQQAIALGEKLIDSEQRAKRISLWQSFASSNPTAYLFCFRGGLRSKTTQQWLAQSGVELPLIPGGYKAVRQYLIQQIESLSASNTFVLLGGRTGSGKTLLLQDIPAHIDLEAQAHHRGSSFGATTTPQPGNINFENAIASALLKLHQQQQSVITLEDEGRMIGSVCIPKALRNKMLESPIVLLEEPADVRVRISRAAYIDELIDAYQMQLGDSGLEAFANHHRNALDKITRRFGSEHKTRARDLFDTALKAYARSQSTTAFDDYVELLLLKYYDPMYDYQLKKKMNRVVFRGSAAAVRQWYEAGSAANAAAHGQ